MKTNEAFLILGDQLFPPSHYRTFRVRRAFMAEDYELCTHYAYNKKKLVMYLSAMRHFADSCGLDVHYERLPAKPAAAEPFIERLTQFLKSEDIRALHFFSIEDKFFETRVRERLASLGVEAKEHQTPKFLTSRPEFEGYLRKTKKPFMKTFYEEQRKRREILVTDEGKPIGGKWSFDTENRKPYRKGVSAPPPKWVKPDAITQEVMAMVDKYFPTHPGTTADFGYPVTHRHASAWLRLFLEERFVQFGTYEDAITHAQPTLYHSLLTPMLNTGLLTPATVVEAALAHARERKVPMNSLEGFIRQVTGWREFVHGIYRNYSVRQEGANFFKHEGKLKSCWYDGTTGILPLDDAIKKAASLGWCHHIERLMIVGNLMLLSRVHPHEAHRWFMEMFVDSADWVMGPNVYGMTQFSDGGIFATKPYICGSNYLLKMSDYKRGPWCDTVDALYWTFIERHQDYFRSNPRLSVMPLALGRMGDAKLEKFRRLASDFQLRVTN